MQTRRTWEREWIAWIKERVAKREQLCMAGCGDPATRIKLLGMRTGAFCAACYREIYHGYIPGPSSRRRGRRR